MVYATDAGVLFEVRVPSVVRHVLVRWSPNCGIRHAKIMQWIKWIIIKIKTHNFLDFWDIYLFGNLNLNQKIMSSRWKYAWQDQGCTRARFLRPCEINLKRVQISNFQKTQFYKKKSQIFYKIHCLKVSKNLNIQIFTKTEIKKNRAFENLSDVLKTINSETNRNFDWFRVGLFFNSSNPRKNRGFQARACGPSALDGARGHP